MDNQTKYVYYIRVSTQMQGIDGLGMQAQKMSIDNYILKRGGVVIGGFEEVVSGRKLQRVELEKAIKMCKEVGAVLLVAKIDRLTRSVPLLYTLKDAGIKFVACDNPEINELAITILAVIAENEAKQISQRIKDAFKAKKEAGFTLGNIDNFEKHRAEAVSNSIKARKQVREKDNAYQGTLKYVCSLLANTSLSFLEIANECNRGGVFKSRQGKTLNHIQISRINKEFGVRQSNLKAGRKAKSSK